MPRRCQELLKMRERLREIGVSQAAFGAFDSVEKTHQLALAGGRGRRNF